MISNGESSGYDISSVSGFPLSSGEKEGIKTPPKIPDRRRTESVTRRENMPVFNVSSFSSSSPLSSSTSSSPFSSSVDPVTLPTGCFSFRTSSFGFATSAKRTTTSAPKSSFPSGFTWSSSSSSSPSSSNFSTSILSCGASSASAPSFSFAFSTGSASSASTGSPLFGTPLASTASASSAAVFSGPSIFGSSVTTAAPFSDSTFFGAASASASTTTSPTTHAASSSTLSADSLSWAPTISILSTSAVSASKSFGTSSVSASAATAPPPFSTPSLFGASSVSSSSSSSAACGPSSPSLFSSSSSSASSFSASSAPSFSKTSGSSISTTVSSTSSSSYSPSKLSFGTPSSSAFPTSFGFGSASSGAASSSAKPLSLRSGSSSAQSVSSTVTATSASTPAVSANPAPFAPAFFSSQASVSSASSPSFPDFGTSASLATAVSTSAATTTIASSAPTSSLQLQSTTAAPVFGIAASSSTAASTDSAPKFSFCGPSSGAAQTSSTIAITTSSGTTCSTVSATVSPAPKLPSETTGKTVGEIEIAKVVETQANLEQQLELNENHQEEEMGKEDTDDNIRESTALDAPLEQKIASGGHSGGEVRWASPEGCDVVLEQGGSQDPQQVQQVDEGVDIITTSREFRSPDEVVSPLIDDEVSNTSPSTEITVTRALDVAGLTKARVYVEVVDDDTGNRVEEEMDYEIVHESPIVQTDDEAQPPTDNMGVDIREEEEEPTILGEETVGALSINAVLEILQKDSEEMGLEPIDAVSRFYVCVRSRESGKVFSVPDWLEGFAQQLLDEGVMPAVSLPKSMLSAGLGSLSVVCSSMSKHSPETVTWEDCVRWYVTCASVSSVGFKVDSLLQRIGAVALFARSKELSDTLESGTREILSLDERIKKTDDALQQLLRQREVLVQSRTERLTEMDRVKMALSRHEEMLQKLEEVGPNWCFT
ncbi:PREDICTED: nuclear pore complex protein NUP62-like [Nelumbo nucifera]|uniref:Nuclear pore complex protein NUP62 n=2 Tax=Nelumbo nucifera TaxID=4432 RepID=A0A822ZEH0_NELNU|nr:PREDICTED: nuclear pore complex protein NUP62-like [Nelumbo nucifera]DAD42131.1 TPA_asm: hypothetical protein HUJ06_000361 [Nelumbo nucifera]